MPSAEDIDRKKRRKIWYSCVGENFFKDEIRRKGRCGKCYYCSKTAKYYCIEVLTDYIEITFGRLFVQTSNKPTELQWARLSDKESSYVWAHPSPHLRGLRQGGGERSVL